LSSTRERKKVPKKRAAPNKSAAPTKRSKPKPAPVEVSHEVHEPTVRIQIPESFDFLFQPARFKGAWGGRGGAKSHSFASGLLTLAASRELRILCCRETQTSIKYSVKRLLDDKIKTHHLSGVFHSTDAEVRGYNGSLFIFAGLRNNVDSIKSLEGIDIAWVEEAQKVSQTSLDILIPTVRKPGSELWFSWNPQHESDPVDVLLRGAYPPPDSIVRYIGHEHNPWFPEVLREQMEYDLRRDPDKWQHIWRGGYQKHSQARVFKNWRVGDPSEFHTTPQTRFYFGGDWGFASDPTVLVRSYIVGRTLYVDHEAWALGCDIDYIPFLFGGCEDEQLQRLNQQAWNSPGMAKWRQSKGIPEARKWPIRADSARPETISYVQRHGFERCEAASKGAGSVEDGIEFLKSYDIVVHPRCRHTIDELTLYRYKVDRQTGEILPILEDKKNHVIDSLRYGHEGAIRPKASISDGLFVGTRIHPEFVPARLPAEF
jgi:phage terminase large subunit